ncbi:DNA recombination protein RmuC [Kineococcus arenarius]|uniref:DNA recombination protein RmuC n=1 Tax=Kineococcus sp. SYSU DK007 TaxID=3383128 RepID=UPI003D7D9AA9
MSIVGAVISLVTAVFALLAWRAASRHDVGDGDPSVGRGLQAVHTLVEGVAGSLRDEHDRLRSAQSSGFSDLRTSQAGELGHLRQEVQAQISGVQDLLRRSTAESGATLTSFSERSVERFDQAQERMSRQQAAELQSLREAVAEQVKQLVERSDALRQEIRAEQQRAAEAGRLAAEALAASQKTAIDELRTSLTERVSDLVQRSEAARDQQAEALRTAGEQTRHELAGFREELTATTAGQRQALADQQGSITQRLGELTATMTQEQHTARRELQTNLQSMTESNEQKLERMRETVAEKLDATLGDRLNSSFQQVTSQLESVHKGLGEMQTLAQGVGSLQRTLTNVKTRGAWAELHLEALLSDVMTPDQYRRQWRVVPDSNEVVDCAIKLPGGEDGTPVWLPIDSKFPTTSYEQLLAAHESGEGVDAAQKALLADIKREAASISRKYVRAPHTTDFAVMYLGTEGLFAEVVRHAGLLQLLRNEHRVVVAGPTTLTALLGSMSMGFRTLAIQERSSEVWRVLGKVKSEFEKSGAVWEKLEKQLLTAGKTAQSAGVRHRAIARSLHDVESTELPPRELGADAQFTIDTLEGRESLQDFDESFELEEASTTVADTTIIRQWARENGLPVSDRGRLADDVVREFHAAQEGQSAQ